MKKSKIFNGVRIGFSLIVGIFNAVIKTVFVDLFKNIGLFVVFAFKPRERKKMRHKLEAEKKLKLVDDRLKVIERLTYSVFNDPGYTKKSEGKYDLKELRRSVNK